MEEIAKYETNENWYNKLLSDLKKLAFEGIVKTKHAIGKRILEDELKFGKPEYGSKRIENLAKDLNISKSDLYYCVQFVKQYPEISNALENFSWRKIVKELLPEHKEKKSKSDLFLYNIWNLGKQDTDTEYYGAFPQIYMENLLNYHTKPNDLIFDPFAGSGTTIRACEKLGRRYYCSDRKVIEGLENKIIKHDIKNGIPKDLPKPDFAFLDPPYWIQAKNKYSNDPEDLANMSLENFYNTFQSFLKLLIDLKIKKIAIVVQPTQYANNMIWEDHIIKFDKMFDDNYEIEMRYILPYQTQQYNAQMLEKAKKMGVCLCLNRDLIVYKLKI